MKQDLFFRKGMKILSLGIMKKVLSFSVVILLLFASCSKEDSDVQIQSNVQVQSKLKAGYSSGYDHGYWWSTWYDHASSFSISFAGASKYAGNFAISWSNIGDGGGGKGWNPGGYRTVGYNVGSLSGYQNFGVYGWTTNPLIEYYITDFGSHGGTYIGSLSSDGGTYKVYKQQRVNAPSIIGTATFWQYKSARTSSQSIGANHSITTGNHFNYWKSHIGSMGTFGEMKLNVEAWGGQSGYVNATVW